MLWYSVLPNTKNKGAISVSSWGALKFTSKIYPFLIPNAKFQIPFAKFQIHGAKYQVHGAKYQKVNPSHVADYSCVTILGALSRGMMTGAARLVL